MSKVVDIRSKNQGKFVLRRLSGGPVSPEHLYHYNQELGRAIDEASDIYVMKMIPKLIELGAVLPEEKGEEGDINQQIDWAHPQNDKLLHEHYYPNLKKLRNEVAEQISIELKKKYPTEVTLGFPTSEHAMLKLIAKYGAITFGTSKTDENVIIGVIVDSLRNGF